jgi:DNA-binding transcriptional regulator GbsR (MarR family)
MVIVEARQRFVDRIGVFFARYGLPATLGRVFALLLISDRALSLDDVADQLTTSKSGVSVAARGLEQLGLVHRHLVKGSRRILYEASDDMTPLFEAQFERIRQQRALLADGTPFVTNGPAQTRLQRMLHLHDFWLAESTGIVQRWREEAEM